MTNYLASDVIYAAYRLCGVLRGPQRGLSASEMADGLEALNSLVDGWNIEPLTIYANLIQQFNLVVNQQSYTIGKDPAGLLVANFDVARPTEITQANIITQVTSGQPVRTALELLNADGWSAIQVQSTGSQIPQSLYNDRGYPFSRLYLWPYPNGAGQIELYTWQQIAEFASESDSFLAPPGYRKAIEFNLAVDLHPRYTQFAMDPSVLLIARETKYALEAHNSDIPVMSCDPALLSARKSTWDYLSGNFTTRTGQ